MTQCWHGIPDKRPDFADMRQTLEDMMSTDLDYLDLDNINVPPGDLHARDNSATSLLIDLDPEPEGAEADVRNAEIFVDKENDEEAHNWAWISLFGDTEKENAATCDTHVPLVVKGMENPMMNNNAKLTIPQVIITQEESDDISE